LKTTPQFLDDTDTFDAAKWLHALVDVSRKIADLEELPAVLQSIVTVVTESVAADAAVVALLNPDQSGLVVQRFIMKKTTHTGGLLGASNGKTDLCVGRLTQ
jgi:GAF domain-containing protein